MRGGLETDAFDGGGLRLVGGLRGFLAPAAADSDGAVIEAPGERGQVVAAGQAIVRLAKGRRPSGRDRPAGHRPPADRLRRGRHAVRLGRRQPAPRVG